MVVDYVNFNVLLWIKYFFVTRTTILRQVISLCRQPPSIFPTVATEPDFTPSANC
jgi:hypothetical protein